MSARSASSTLRSEESSSFCRFCTHYFAERVQRYVQNDVHDAVANEVHGEHAIVAGALQAGEVVLAVDVQTDSIRRVFPTLVPERELELGVVDAVRIGTQPVGQSIGRKRRIELQVKCVERLASDDEVKHFVAACDTMAPPIHFLKSIVESCVLLDHKVEAIDDASDLIRREIGVHR